MACRGNPLSREHTQSSQRLISRTNEHFLNPNPGFPLRGVKLGSFERPDSAWIDPEMRNTITEGRAHEARDRFIDSIDEGDVLRLASSHHNGELCAFFKPPVRGTYNICYFVRFGGSESDGNGGESAAETEDAVDRDLWVVRIPLEPHLCIPAHEKVESEVAVMQ